MKAVGGDAEPVVNGYTFIGANYEAAWAALKHPYDNKRKIVESHLAIFLNAKALQEESANGIRHILDVTNETTMSLSAQGVPVDKWDVILAHVILTKLPRETRAAWELESKSSDLVKIAELKEFLEARAYGLDPISTEDNSTRSTNVSTNFKPKQQSQQKPQYSSHSWKSIKTNVATEETKCAFCNGIHRNFRCPDFLKLTPFERYERLYGTNLCFNCLQAGHSSKGCRSQACNKCDGNKKHNTLLCRGSRRTSQGNSNTASSSSSGANHSESTPPRNFTREGGQ